MMDATQEPALGVLLDVPLEVRVHVGSCIMPIKEILELGDGSVVELTRNVDEPVDLLVNDTIVARGHIVAVDDSFGVRITEVVRAPASPA